MESHSVVIGSLQDVANKNDASISESFLSADVLVLIDVSGSMDAQDSRGGRTRYAVACDALADLQRSAPGKIAVVAFGTEVQFCPGGVPIFLGGGTRLDIALRFVQPADGTVDFVLISDGQPSDELAALAVAREFVSKIDTIYVGPEEDRTAREFMRKLANLCSGQHLTVDRARELSSTISTLLLKA